MSLRTVVAAFALALATGAHGELPVVQLTAGMHLIRAEVADTFASRMQELMYRKSLAQNAGMLFVFEETSVHWRAQTGDSGLQAPGSRRDRSALGRPLLWPLPGHQ